MQADIVWERSELTEESVLGALDAETEGEWPIFRSDEERLAYHALRLVVFRKPEGDSYAIVLEALLGGQERDLRLLRTVVSPDGAVLADDRSGAELYLEGSWNPEGENVIVGPAGEVTVTMNDLLALEPQRATVGAQVDMLFTLLVRAYLSAEPNAVWADVDILRRKLAPDFDLAGYEPFLQSTSFEHVVGTTWVQGDPDGIDLVWRRLPRASATYCSLAKAIVAGDPTLFEPGESNLSWRLHLDAPNGSRRLR